MVTYAVSSSLQVSRFWFLGWCKWILWLSDQELPLLTIHYQELSPQPEFWSLLPYPESRPSVNENLHTQKHALREAGMGFAKQVLTSGTCLLQEPLFGFGSTVWVGSSRNWQPLTSSVRDHSFLVGWCKWALLSTNLWLPLLMRVDASVFSFVWYILASIVWNPNNKMDSSIVEGREDEVEEHTVAKNLIRT